MSLRREKPNKLLIISYGFSFQRKLVFEKYVFYNIQENSYFNFCFEHFFYKDSTCARARADVFGQLHLKMVSLEKQE